METEPGRPSPHRRDDRHLCREHERDEPVRLRGEPPLDAADAGALGSSVCVAADDVEPAAEVVADAGQQDRRGRLRPGSRARDGRSARPRSRHRSHCASRAVDRKRSTRVESTPSPAAGSVMQRSLALEARRDGVERALQVAGAAGRLGEPHRTVLAAREQDRRVARHGHLAALVLAPHLEVDRGAGRPPRGSGAVTRPASSACRRPS